MFNNTKDVLRDFNEKINNKEPFSLIRLGDGGLKFIYSIYFNDIPQMEVISEKEGIPVNTMNEILRLWSQSINISDYIDSPQYYFTPQFWSRVRKQGKKMKSETTRKMKNWRFLYKLSKFENRNYCNPEINFLSCLDYLDMSMLDIMKDKKICCICANSEELSEILSDYNINYVKIVKSNQNQYYNSFDNVIKYISNNAAEYDFWLVAAGELGRIYSGYIKHKNGRSFDIGSLVDFWESKELPVRLEPFIEINKKNPLKISLKKEAKKYMKYI